MVDLATAKLHLHITDPADDPEVTYTLSHAATLVQVYLGADAATTPPDLIDRGTLLALALFWEHRGDDSAPDDYAAAFWREMTELFRQTRTPALA